MSEWIVKQNTDGQLDVVGELIRCKDCRAFDDKSFICKKNQMVAVGVDDWYSRAERKEE